MTEPNQPSLQRVRRARGLELDDVAAALVRSLGLPDDVQGGVRRHYRDLEGGRLDPADVAATVWAALAKILARDAEALVEPPAPVIEASARYVHADTLDRALTDYALGRRREPLSPDEVDRLFGAAPGDDG